ncbi:uncharacterized protein ACLA_099050 [Aspergillus clavatus NRRL 1]|uniref:Uncharacterized protein n=1 Tax=Aspergillus clavatus (strain ATCC 1007 / CBS 513.65 / DSM 816 / NCTC 3887 / NRRL 1 / QM 1276 / 107) TaxID=344612 RepID=A1CN24_ASPCL|nr:uncharacterized protein ACLA_099050 [Aspergillus clavatus NRRL 1]EAW08961.1 conserved hypothetical protein [Aspergillus clavatus NRRL 1]
MSTRTQPTPVVLCGRKTAIGGPVSQVLLPEYEVIHFIQSYEAAEAELPHLLTGRDPQSQNPNDVGTHDYTRPARAVIFGRGFEPKQVEALKDRFGASAKEPVAWIAGNPADVPVGAPGPDYAVKVAQGVKVVLERWKTGDQPKDELIMY